MTALNRSRGDDDSRGVLHRSRGDDDELPQSSSRIVFDGGDSSSDLLFVWHKELVRSACVTSLQVSVNTNGHASHARHGTTHEPNTR